MIESKIVGSMLRNIDDKNRIIVPANFETRTEDLYAISREDCISVYSQNVAKSKLQLTEADYGTLNFLHVDNQNRLRILEQLILAYKIKKQIALIGKNDHFDLVSIIMLEDYLKRNGYEKVCHDETNLVLRKSIDIVERRED